MELVLKFVTALAWIWGTWMAIGAACGLFIAIVHDTSKDAASIARMILWGIPAWSWLLARYCL